MSDIRRPAYLDRIVPFVDKPLIKVLTGMRRVGKSSLVRLLAGHLRDQGVPDSRIICINKESMDSDFIRDAKELYQYVLGRIEDSPAKPYLFIDEVQEISNWERAVNSLLADGRADITITGSNAELLSSELATLISGRYVEFAIPPLTYGEFLAFRGAGIGDSPEEFRRYLRYGGLPGISPPPRGSPTS